MFVSQALIYTNQKLRPPSRPPKPHPNTVFPVRRPPGKQRHKHPPKPAQPPPNPPFPSPRGPRKHRHPNVQQRPLKPAPTPSSQSFLASKHPPRPGNPPRPHARTTASSRDGIATSTSTKLARGAATAAQSAKFKDAPLTGPATADPTGLATEFNDIDTAKPRPNHAWSVRLCLSANKPMS